MIKSDRERSAKLRRITLDESIKIMESNPTEEEDIKFKQALHLRLAGNVLPRINEVTGEDGQPIVIQVAQEGALKYDLTSGTSANSIGQSPVQSS